jgi:hypothetical protein
VSKQSSTIALSQGATRNEPPPAQGRNAQRDELNDEERAILDWFLGNAEVEPVQWVMYSAESFAYLESVKGDVRARVKCTKQKYEYLEQFNLELAQKGLSNVPQERIRASKAELHADLKLPSCAQAEQAWSLACAETIQVPDRSGCTVDSLWLASQSSRRASQRINIEVREIK